MRVTLVEDLNELSLSPSSSNKQKVRERDQYKQMIVTLSL